MENLLHLVVLFTSLHVYVILSNDFFVVKVKSFRVTQQKQFIEQFLIIHSSKVSFLRQKTMQDLNTGVVPYPNKKVDSY